MTALPGGTFTIPPEAVPRLDAIVGGDALALWAFMAATGGMGVSIEEFFAKFGCTMEDGPMLGEWAVEFEQDLEPGREYTVHSEILGVEPKEGRSMRFDLVRVRTVLEGAATCHFTYVVPATTRPGGSRRWEQSPGGRFSRPTRSRSSWTREIRPGPMADFSDLLQDPNPIHLDEAAAGGRVINQGPVNAGYVIAMLRAAYPDTAIKAIKLRFLSPVRGGDSVTADSEVTGEDGPDVHLRVWLDIDDGPRAVEGSATLRRT